MKIIINALTHKDAACYDIDDVAVYEERFPKFIERLTAAALANGIRLEVDPYGQGLSVYRVDNLESYDDLVKAHDLMQSPVADIWS